MSAQMWVLAGVAEHDRGTAERRLWNAMRQTDRPSYKAVDVFISVRPTYGLLH